MKILEMMTAQQNNLPSQFPLAFSVFLSPKSLGKPPAGHTESTTETSTSSTKNEQTFLQHLTHKPHMAAAVRITPCEQPVPADTALSKAATPFKPCRAWGRAHLAHPSPVVAEGRLTAPGQALHMIRASLWSQVMCMLHQPQLFQAQRVSSGCHERSQP